MNLTIVEKLLGLRRTGEKAGFLVGVRMPFSSSVTKSSQILAMSEAISVMHDQAVGFENASSDVAVTLRCQAPGDGSRTIGNHPPGPLSVVRPPVFSRSVGARRISKPRPGIRIRTPLYLGYESFGGLCSLPRIDSMDRT